ncbi:MAG: hypothetical protein V3S98_03910 [Dehalococcoidia bacterium]
MELEDGVYWSMALDAESSVIELVWTARTAAMTDQDFKEGVDHFTTFAEQHGATGLSVDVREFGHQMNTELGEWRQDKIVPRYNSAGIQRFAYVLPQGAPLEEPTQYEGENFKTGYFSSPEAASSWLAAAPRE